MNKSNLGFLYGVFLRQMITEKYNITSGQDVILADGFIDGKYFALVARNELYTILKGIGEIEWQS